MQAATASSSSHGGVYLGSGIPSSSNSNPTGVKKWKNKLKTFLNSPTLPSNSSNSNSNSNNHNSNSNSNNISLSPASVPISSALSSASSASVTPRPESPPYSSTSTFAIGRNSNTPKPSVISTTNNTHSFPSSSSSNIFNDDVYAGYDISVDNHYSSSSNHADINKAITSGSTGPNDSYEARLSRLVGDLENVDYSSFANFAAGAGAGDESINNSIIIEPGLYGNGQRSRTNSGEKSNEVSNVSRRTSMNNIHISSSLFNDANVSMNDNLSLSNHPFAYPSAGTPSHLDLSTGNQQHHHQFNSSSSTTSLAKPFKDTTSNFLSSNSLSFPSDQFSLSNGIVTIEDALNSFNTPFSFTDFSAYTNLDDDDNNSNGDIRIPSFDTIQSQQNGTSSTSQAPTPSSMASIPLTAAHSASSNASGKSTAATSEITMGHHQQKYANGGNGAGSTMSSNSNMPMPFSMPDLAQLHDSLSLPQSSSMPFRNDGTSFSMLPESLANFDVSMLAPSILKEQDTQQGDKTRTESDDDDDDFSDLLRQSQINGDSATEEPTQSTNTRVGNGIFQLPASSVSASTSLLGEPPSPLDLANFDLKLFPMPKNGSGGGTSSVKMGSQPSSGSESSYGPSPSLSYGGSSTSNTSFDDPNAIKDGQLQSAIHFTPKKAKAGKNGNLQNLSVTVEEDTLPSSSSSNLPLTPVKTPTHSPHPSISSCPPTPASYKTAHSMPTSPYRDRPIVHASALAWRVAPSPMSPQSAIAVNTARTIRPVASQSFISTDPFASPVSPNRLNKLNTASSPELKRRRNVNDEEDVDSPTIDGRLMAAATIAPASNMSQMISHDSGTSSPNRPIAGRRRVAGKMSVPHLQMHAQNQQQLQPPQAAPMLHQRQYSQPLPMSTHQHQPYYTPPQSAHPSSTQLHSYTSTNLNAHSRQYTSPLPSPSSAVSQFTQQQQQPLPTSSSSSWLSDDLVSSLFSQLSDSTYMCLMQNCNQRFGSVEDAKNHATGHFAPQPVPLAQSQPIYQQQHVQPLQQSIPQQQQQYQQMYHQPHQQQTQQQQYQPQQQGWV